MVDKEKIRYILQGVLLLSEGCNESKLIEYGIPRNYLNQIRSIHNMLKEKEDE